MSNPLIEMEGLPPFQRILSKHVEPAIDQALAQNRATLKTVLDSSKPYSWDTLVQPLEEMDEWLSRIWSPVSHMNSVVNSESLREAYNACLPKLSDYGTEMGQNRQLCEAFKSIAGSPDLSRMNNAQQRIIDNALRDFRLAGVNLPAEKQDRYKEIQQQLSRLTSKFEENLLDATQAWIKHITTEEKLAGLPESARVQARQAAQQRELDGWVFTLEFPSYYAVMTYADDAELRHELYEAHVTRASDQGPDAAR